MRNVKPFSLIAAACGLVVTMLALPVVAGVYEAPLDAASGQGQEATFTAKPAAAADGDQVKITFAVSAPTDVEVAILDGRGSVVRHLAAGLLGKNAPAPFARDKLDQTLVWDRKDDVGKAVLGEKGTGTISEKKLGNGASPLFAGPFKVRVRLGARPRLEKIAGRDNNTFGSIIGLAISPDSEIYLLLTAGGEMAEVRVLDKTGKYLRTIMPYAADTPAERLKSIGQLGVGGERLPIVFNAHSGNLLPLTTGMRKQAMAFNPKGYLVMASAVGTPEEQGPPRHLLALSPRGGSPAGMNFVGPEVREARGYMGGAGDFDLYFEHLAASPDGKWIYYVPTFWNFHHAVFRLNWADRGEGMEAGFVGQEWIPGGDDRHLNDPEGVAVDKDGNLYVCDRGNDRVMVFDAAGKLLGKFAVEDPEQIAVHPKSGEIYVACRDLGNGGRKKDVSNLSEREYQAWKVRDTERSKDRPKARPGALIKFSPFGQAPPKETARAAMQVELMAIDPNSAPGRLWAVVGKDLIMITDQNGTLVGSDPVSNTNGLNHPTFIAADPARNRVLVREMSTGIANKPIRSLDLATDKKTPLLECTEVAISREGTIYGMGRYGSNVMYAFEPDGKPHPLPGSDSNKIEPGTFSAYGPDIGLRGHCVAPNGDIYLIRSSKWGAGEGGIGCRVDVIGPDGKKKKAAVVDGLGYGDCGIGVDAAGNIYLGANVKPANQPFPKDFAAAVPADGWLWWRDKRDGPWAYPYYNPYLYHWGAVFKFPASGGAYYGQAMPWFKASPGGPPPSKLVAVENAPAGAATYRSGYLAHDVKVAGALWRYPGMGIVPTSDSNWGDPSCICRTARLAVDEYGRVFVPDTFRFRVEMLDTNGNQLGHVGQYGNADSVGPEITFAWPAYVSVADGKMYVCDSTNRRISVIAFDYAAAEECPAP